MSSTMLLSCTKAIRWPSLHVNRWGMATERWLFHLSQRPRILRSGRLMLSHLTSHQRMATDSVWLPCTAGRHQNPSQLGDRSYRNLRRCSFRHMSSPAANSKAVVASTNAPINRVDSSVLGDPFNKVRLRVCSTEERRASEDPVAAENCSMALINISRTFGSNLGWSGTTFGRPGSMPCRSRTRER